MRENLVELIDVKFVFFVLVGMFFFSSCQNVSVISQSKPKVSRTSTPHIEDMQKGKKLESLEDLKWEKRIIIVKEDGDDGLRLLRDSVEAINERHIVWFRLRDGKIETNYKGELAEDFSDKLKNKYFEKFDEDVFLIGKDGTIKSKDNKLDLKNYFGQIDSMPMRRQEMKEDN
jgi:hypothetical protein